MHKFWMLQSRMEIFHCRKIILSEAFPRPNMIPAKRSVHYEALGEISGLPSIQLEYRSLHGKVSMRASMDRSRHSPNQI